MELMAGNSLHWGGSAGYTARPWKLRPLGGGLRLCFGGMIAIIVTLLRGLS